MNKVYIRKNNHGDTRTAPKDTTYEQFKQANESHISEVDSVMSRIGFELEHRARAHDFTKKTRKAEFWRDFKDTLDNGGDFTEKEWYKMHIAAERHHLANNCPEDVDLLDVIEMIADCVVAGKTRSEDETFYMPLYIDSPTLKDILVRAYVNTIRMIDDMTILETFGDVHTDCEKALVAVEE